MIDHSYAQTNRQLFSQMQQKGYSPAEVVKVRAAHELARTLVTGFYRPSGSPFISHLVGTASVLAGLRVPVELVMAGLLHAAYMHGDFGTLRRGATAKNREVVRQAVGAEVEEYVARYTEWRRKTIDGLKDRMNSMNFVDRNVVLICLANWLEHLLDFDILCGPGVDRRLQAIMRRGPILVDAAHMLGYPSLGEELESLHQQTLNTEIVQAFGSGDRPGGTFLVAPLSYRKRLLPAACQIAGKTTRRLRSAVRRRLKRRDGTEGARPTKGATQRLHTGV